jgi:Tol biopolymer transport system component
MRRYAIATCALAAVTLAGGTADATSPHARNGHDIAFSRNGQIYVADRDGRDARRLHAGDGEEFGPAYSPDGERIAFTRSHWAGDDTIYELFVMDDDGRHVHRLGSGTEPRWRPDGRTIVFVRGRGGIYSMDARGRHVRRLTRDGSEPDYSPDGRLIVFHRNDPPHDGDPGIFVMRADGTHVRRLTRSPAVAYNPVDTFPGHLYFDWYPRFAPDGKHIVFIRQRGWDAASYGDVFVMDPNGKHVRDLTPPDPYYHAFSKPAYSPDGRKILADGLYVMHADGSHGHQLPARGLDPDWQPLPGPGLTR